MTVARVQSARERDSHTEVRHIWLAAVLLSGVALFVIAFCAATPARRLACAGILIPDVLVLQWLGGDPARFGLADRAVLLAVAAWILGIAGLLGRLLLDALRVDRVLSWGEQIVFSLAMGTNVLSLLTLAFGLAGQMHRGWFVGLTLAAISGGAVRWRYWRTTATNVQSTEDGYGRLALWIAVPFTLLILLGGMLPPWYFDVREYHLQVPKEWFLHGSIDFLPHNVYGNMTLGASMHALLGMMLLSGPDAWWWGALAGKTIIAAFAPLTAWAVFLMGRRFFGRGPAAVGAVFFISTPWVTHVSAAGMIDVVSAFYCITAVHAALLWSHVIPSDPPNRAARWSLPAMSGFLAGAGVACKYPAVLFLVVPLLVWIVFAGRPRWDARAPAVFLLAVALGCGLWLAKNWVQSGNPTYPLLYSWFEGKTRTPEKDAQWQRAHNLTADTAEQRLSVAGLRNSGALITRDSYFASPLLAPFALIGLFSKAHRRDIRYLASFCGYVLLAWWLTTHRVDRFLVPIIPLVSLLAGIGATWSAQRLWRRGAAVVIGLGLAYCLLINASRFTGDNRYLVSLAQLRTDRPHPSDPDWYHLHPAHDLLNQIVEPGYLALLVGEAQVFNLQVPILYNTCFDDCLFEQLMRGRDREERNAALRAARISHIMFFWRELDRYRSPGNYGYSDYVTRELVRQELVVEQGLLRRLPLDVDPDSSEVYEVIGWEEWQD